MENKEEKKNKNGWLIVLLLTLVIVVTASVSYAFFNYIKLGSTENVITTGNLMFVYDEMASSGNGIAIINALPISDDVGKTLATDNQSFTFQILADVHGLDISYEIYAEKQVGSTLPEDKVKLYLTNVSADASENAIGTTLNGNVVKTYHELANTTLADTTGKTLYTEIIPNGTSNYSKKFRLRMWVSEDAVTTDETSGAWDYNNQMFSVKVSVKAQG